MNTVYVILDDDSPLTKMEGRWSTEESARNLISVLPIRRVTEIAPNVVEVRYDSMLVGARITFITV